MTLHVKKELLDEFRVWCAQHSVTLQDQIEAILIDWLEKQDGK